MNKTLLILLLAVTAGCGASGTPEYVYHAEADATVALAFGVDPVYVPDTGPAPPDNGPKPGDKCPDCRGTGRTGDGQGRCGTCGGDGRIDERDVQAKPPALVIGAVDPLPVQPPRKEVILHVTKENAAGWPQEWWRTDREKLIDNGWVVSVVREEGPSADPWFEVDHKGRVVKLFGKQTIQDIESCYKN